ncbi:MAG: hypothetical protein V1904_03695 [Bacteroidota bacterium]
MKKLALIVFIIFFTNKTYGQDTLKTTLTNYPLDFGYGLGIDYGGIGARFTYLPLKQIGIFAAIGFNLLNFGYNAGLVYRVTPNKKKLCPYANFFYGYNAVIKIKGTTKYDKIYYGFSSGVGLEIYSKKRSNIFHFELVVPFRTSEFNNDYEAIKNDPNIKLYNNLFPVLLSFGFHFPITSIVF